MRRYNGVIDKGTKDNGQSYVDELITREAASTRLVESYHGCKSGIRFVLVSGPSGAGKTSLTCSLENVVLPEGGFFLRGKFDQLAYSYDGTTLYAPFVDAFTSYIEAVAANGEEAVKIVQKTLEAALDRTERQVLHDMIPALGMILRTPSSGVFLPTQSPIIKGPDAERRFVRIFSLFVKAVCSCGAPIVLFLDDIQWATQSDLNVLESLTELGKELSRNSRFILLCAYRNNEAPADYPWPSTFNKIRSGLSITITEIEVTNKTEVEVRCILSATLDCPSIDIDPLSKAVFEHTCGNILFVKILLDEFKGGTLSHLSYTEELEYYKRCLESHCNSVEKVIESKVKRLTTSAQMLLKLGSCVGSKFSEEIVSVVSGGSPSPVLLEVQGSGLVSFDRRSRVFHFAHDKFQNIVYSLIPESERALSHLRIGRKLWRSMSGEARESNLLLIGHQLSRGAHLLTTPDEQYDAAEILSRAGQKAAVSSAFATAAVFLNHAISLLRKERWITHYDLCLQLYSFTAEIEYYNGNLKRVDELVTEVFQHGRSLQDKLKAHYTRIYSLGSRNEMEKALDESMEVFKSLGETFPRHPCKSNIVMGLVRCNRKLRGKSDEYILNLPLMRDWRRLAGMRLMTIVAFFAFYLRDKILPLIVFRLIHQTLQYGMSDSASVGFATWAFICARRGDVENANRYGRLALRIYKKYESKECQARVVLAVYTFVYSLKHSYRKLLQPLKDAHRVGLVVGDLHLSMSNAITYNDILYLVGTPLKALMQNLTTYQSLCKQYRQVASLVAVELRIHFCRNLMGPSIDANVLTGGDTTTEEELSAAIRGKNQILYMWLHVLKLALAMYMNNHSAAQDISRRLLRLPTNEAVPYQIGAYLFFDGLLAAILSKTNHKEKRRAASIIAKLKKHADHSPSNHLHRVHLIEAEMATSAGKYDEAFTKYQQSIARAGRHGLIHEQALACERASYALQLWQRPNEAQEYLVKAQNLYMEWGAKAKSDQLAAMM